MKKCQSFLSKNFQFLEVKSSIYFNRLVFVMRFQNLSKWDGSFPAHFLTNIWQPFLSPVSSRVIKLLVSGFDCLFMFLGVKSWKTFQTACKNSEKFEQSKTTDWTPTKILVFSILNDDSAVYCPDWKTPTFLLFFFFFFFLFTQQC